MPTYQPRPGVVAARLCGQLVLIPSRAIYDVCGTMLPVPPKWAPLWRLLEQGAPLEQIYAYYRPLYTNPSEEVDRLVDTVLESLADKGFLCVGAPGDGHE